MTSRKTAILKPTRRAFLLSSVALATATAMPVLPVPSFAAEEPTRGGSVSINVGTEPPDLVLIAHSAGAAYYISGKATESLLSYEKDFNPQPLLATEWTVSEDGLR